MVISISSNRIIDQRYQIVTTIGQGGMGKVYLVVDLEKNRQVALKTLEHDLNDQAAWGRFEREARNASRLNHPNIARVYDFGKLTGAVPYLVMELVTGQTLHERIKTKGPLSEEETLTVFLAMSAALQHAHQMDILHRDIKPSNIIVVTDPVGKIVDAKLIDFGLAKCFGADEFAQSLTATGEIIGSPYYMSPEHWNSEALGPGSDIYSLGITLFETLTGKVPFSGENAFATAISHNTADLPLLANFDTTLLDESDWQIVLNKMLAKSINDRYSSGSQLTHDLHCIANGEAVNEQLEKAEIYSPAKTSKLNQIWLLVGASALFLLLTTLVSLYFSLTNKPMARMPNHPDLFDRMPSHVDRAAVAKPNFTVHRDRKRTVFKFPQKKSLGTMTIGKSLVDKKAMGKIEVMRDEEIQFRPNELFLAHPELFQKFGANDLTRLFIQGEPLVINDELLTNINHLTRLQTLVLRNCYLTAKAEATFNCFPHLVNLTLVDTEISGEGIAKFRRLRQLDTLTANDVTNPSVFLTRLSGQSQLRCLSLKNAGLKDNDLKLIAQIANLRDLTIGGNRDITNQGLAYLADCKELRKLQIKHIPIKPGCAEVLAKMKGLTLLLVSPRSFSDADVSALHRALPECKIDFGESEGE